jgi:hypothetical protein
VADTVKSSNDTVKAVSLKPEEPCATKRPVYVLGAGFCRDFHPGLFPLAWDFLKIAKSLYRYRPDEYHPDLAAFIVKYFGDEIYPDIERVLSFLASTPVHDPQIQPERQHLYDQLVNIISDTLNAATASVMGRRSTHSKRRPPDVRWEVYSSFVRHLVEKRAVLITFNYDLLLELFLTDTQHWRMDDGYGIHIPLILELSPIYEPSIDLANNAGKSACLLLKLHGSINWGSPVTGTGNQTQRPIYRLPEGGSPLAFGSIRVDPSDETKRIAYRPVIIPPVLDKSTMLGHSKIRELWSMAMESVRNADEVTVIGYSLPLTDFPADFMFREACHRSAQKVTLVCPDAAEKEVLARFTSVFGANVNPISSTFLDWAIERFKIRSSGWVS